MWALFCCPAQEGVFEEGFFEEGGFSRNVEGGNRLAACYRRDARMWNEKCTDSRKE